MRCVMVRGWKPPRRRMRWGWAAVPVMLAALMLACLPLRPVDDVTAQPALAEAQTLLLPENILLGLPACDMQRMTITTQRLLQGRMLLVDEAHPIPEGVNAPNTFGVLSFAHGRIACRDQQAVLGKETLMALADMCVDARNSGINYLTVFAGTRSLEQQRILLNEKVAELSRDMSMEEAVAKAKEDVPPPGCSEHQLPWTVDIRICRAWNVLPDADTLGESREGGWLLNHAWTYGFVQRWPEADPATDSHRPYCFRYVGLVHARLMHELGMCMEEYVALLREYGAVTLLDENGAPLMAAVCAAAGERHTVFEMPVDIELEDASLDNTGWAVTSFTFR